MKYYLALSLTALVACAPEKSTTLVCKDKYGREALTINNFLSESNLVENEYEYEHVNFYVNNEEKYKIEITDFPSRFYEGEELMLPESMLTTYEIEIYGWNVDGTAKTEGQTCSINKEDLSGRCWDEINARRTSVQCSVSLIQ